MGVRCRCTAATAAAVAVLVLAGGRAASAADPPDLSTPEDRFSYGLGARLGIDLRRSSHEVDHELVIRGFREGLGGSASLSEEEIAAALEEGVRRKIEREEAQREAGAQSAEEEARAFLALNREREGVVELESGLQYEVLQQGSGPVPGDEDFVTCHYRATLLDGTVFDDSTAQGRPRTFAVSSVVDGFEQALRRMPVGARWRIYVPAELGYGATGAGSKIPPNSALIFEVELLSVEPPPSG